MDGYFLINFPSICDVHCTVKTKKEEGMNYDFQVMLFNNVEFH